MQMSAPRSGRRVMLVFNPAAGGRRRERLAATLAQLRAAGCEVTLRETATRGDAERLAAEATSSAIDLLAVAGGDGTIGEVVNGMMTADAGGVPIALIPLGTANVLAAEIGLPATAAAAARAIVGGSWHPVHVGRANGRCFTVMAGVGFDARVVAGVDLGLKRRFGKLAYIVSAAHQLWRGDFPRYRVTVDGQTCEAAAVIVAKGHYYGGRFVCAPEARIDAQEFHVCLFERGGRWPTVRYGIALGLGRLPRVSGYRIVRGREVTIDGPPDDPVQGDGDIIATLPVRIALEPRPLRLVMPA